MSVYLREIPSNEAFNSDPDLIKILNKNQIIIETNSPLFISHPTQADQNGTNSQSSKSLLHIISYTHLYKSRRFPQSESLYSLEFSKTVKAKYGSSSQYLKDRLGFNQSSSELRFDEDGTPIDYFKASSGLIDGLDYKVIKNEWPYAINHGYQFSTF
ncbi:hypothetical protein DFH28DRAFT_928529 [Melampsora americana]|nr:hypothetical protein DFH28DRAFT_928529 [Melampsora americana]